MDKQLLREYVSKYIEKISKDKTTYEGDPHRKWIQ